MDVFESIEQRRSIRKFKPESLPQPILDKILSAAAQAPSGKNKQPWSFTIVSGDRRSEMVEVMHTGISRLESEGLQTGSARATLRVMTEAPITIFVFNPTGKHPLLKRNISETYADVVDIQSIGAAIQNMLLAAQALGVGSLWICDVFFGYEELCEWLGDQGQMIAAVSLGYPAQAPASRPRKPLGEIVRFLS